jgi:hypothetical protein
VLGITGSSGDGGRAFKSMNINVTTSSDNHAVAMSVQDFYRTQYVVSPPIPLPLGMFPIGLNNIVVTLCNFLGQCGFGAQQLTVNSLNSPVVSIAGDAVASITRSEAVSFSADAFVSKCNGSVGNVGLIYTWAAFKDGSQDHTIISTSKESNKFTLKPYTLSTNSVWTFTLTVIDTATSLSSVDSVSLNVVPGKVVANIKGRGTTAVAFQGTLTLDASNSVDKDIAGLTGTAAGLSFIWSCIQTAPVVLASCGMLLPAVTNSSTLTLNALTSGTTSVLTVTVIDLLSGRSATATVTATVQTVSQPLVLITNTTSSNQDLVGKLNPDTQLVLEATITLATLGTFVWSVNDTSVDLTNSYSYSTLSPISGSALVVGMNYVL